MDKISPCLWFNFNAEEAVAHYLRIFKRSRVVRTLRYGKEQPELAGKVLMIEFELEGRSLQALNGGPQFQFNEAISLSVACDSQAEVDDLWAKLIAGGGSPSACGWLKDRFGVSWQIVPPRLIAMLADPDAQKAMRAMQAMMTMSKIDIAAVEKAFAGR
jgi:predicted 3-demethylubiquinone-9 3-methyltransferase (glyoxalase superfamily)